MLSSPKKFNRLKTPRVTKSSQIFRDEEIEKHDFSRMTEDITKAENITFINNEVILSLQSLNLMELSFDMYKAFPQDHKHCPTACGMRS